MHLQVIFSVEHNGMAKCHFRRGCDRETTLYVCCGGLLEEGAGGSYVTMGGGDR